MNKLIKKIVSVVTALAVTLSVAVMFDIPEKISAAAEESHSHKACADSSHENCTHSEVEYEPFPATLDGFKLDLKNIIIEDDKNYYLAEDMIDGTFTDIQICIKDATVNFCLNGHKLDVKGIRVSGKGELNVCDCKTDGCFTTEYKNTDGILETRTGGILNIYSGKIQVKNIGIAVNCGAHDEDGSSVTNIYGGEINGNIIVGNVNTLSIYGGTVKHDTEDPVASRTGISVLNRATVNINGGSIVGGEYGIVAVYSNSTININGGSVESKDKYAIWIQNGTVCNINGGTVTSASTDHSTVYTVDKGVININGGEVVGKNYGAVYCDNDGTVRISNGEVRTESTAPTCIYNNMGTLIVSGGKVFGEEYGIRNYNSGATTTISGGTVSCKGTGVYNYSNGVFEINGGEIISENTTGIANASTLNVSGGVVSGGTYGIRNFGSDAVTTISEGDVSSKGNICINNYNSGALNITGGKVSGGEYCIYNSEGTTTISGGIVSAKGSYALYNEEKGTAVINGGTLNSTFSPITNYGTLNISGGSFGAENPATTTYMINQKNMNLSGSPVFRNAPIWLKTDDNIGITGALDLSEPCAVYINSAVPRIFTSGWSTHMQGQKPSDYFKSPYSICTVDTDSSGEALLRNFIVTFDANGGACGTATANIDSDGKISPLPEATKEKCNFDGWFTEKTGGEQVTTDTVFTDDTTIYAHWTCNDHIWGDTYEKDENQHWKVCTVCSTEKSEVTAHSWNDGEITKQPTENEAGVMLYTCTVCKATKTEPIAPLDHTHDWNAEWSKDDTYHWHDCLKICGEKKDNAAHIWNDGTITKQPTADAEGEKTFECTVCGKTKTETLPPKDEPSDPNSGNISVDVQPGENAPDTELKTPFDELADAVLTPEEQESIKNGIDIKIILIVSDATESVPADDRAKVEAAIRGLSGYKLGQYLDLNLLKIIGNSEGVRITQTNKPITVTFEIPAALRGKAEYSVIRIHGGETEVLRDLDNDSDTVTIETDKFSTYALVYKEKSTPSNPGGGNTSGGNSGDSPNPPTSTPDNSDNSDDTPSDDDNPSRDDSSDTTSSESKPTDEDNSDATSSDDGNAASSDDGNTTSSESDTSSNVSDHSPSESSPSEDNGNPSTGIAVSLIPLVTATAILTVAVKRKKK